MCVCLFDPHDLMHSQKLIFLNCQPLMRMTQLWLTLKGACYCVPTGSSISSQNSTYSLAVCCSLGYSMDTYSSDKDIKNINSQANEQANAKLRLLSTQAVNMGPENLIQHVKVFLATRNMDKILNVARVIKRDG